MILEIATITVAATRCNEFEMAFSQARKLIVQAPGCGPMSLQRCVETPGRYQVLIEWPSIAHHEAFRASVLFPEYRAIIGPLFAAPPLVEHYERAG